VPDATPTEIARSGARELTITWSDGHTSVYTTRLLRESCGCAACVDEWTGKTRIVPGSIPETVDVVDAEIVGAYAVRFVFSDTHSDGIYSYRRLRQFCPCADCTMTRSRGN
jgi:DUF971 family protein